MRTVHTTKKWFKRLPAKICILDVETASLVDFNELDKAEIAIVGVQEFHLKGQRYFGKKYQCFSGFKRPGFQFRPLTELGKYLRDFQGIVIGHNILDFDFRVLKPHIPHQKILKKTVDLMAILYDLNKKYHWGLALDNLCKKNLNKSKTAKGKTIPKLWKAGKWNQVIKYNQRDILLTQNLWFHLLKTRIAYVRYEYHPEGGNYVHLRVRKREEVLLLGKKSYISEYNWAKAVETGGKILPYNPFTSPYQQFLREQEAMADSQKPYPVECLYHWRYCPKCRLTNLYYAPIQCGFADHEITRCSKCSSELGEVRADLSLETIGTVKGNMGAGQSQGIFPKPFAKAILKFWQAEERKYPHLFKVENGCESCGVVFEYPDEIYVSPDGAMSVCMPCLTSGKWMFNLK